MHLAAVLLVPTQDAAGDPAMQMQFSKQISSLLLLRYRLSSLLFCHSIPKLSNWTIHNILPLYKLLLPALHCIPPKYYRSCLLGGLYQNQVFLDRLHVSNLRLCQHQCSNLLWRIWIFHILIRIHRWTGNMLKVLEWIRTIFRKNCLLDMELSLTLQNWDILVHSHSWFAHGQFKCILGVTI
jgi:hypothetical protein